MLSDRGRVRRRNEDACAASSIHPIFVVCDGMGGAAGGDVASHLAAETFLFHLSRRRMSTERQSSSQVRTQIVSALQAANKAIYQQAQKTPQLSGMGTTLVALVHVPAGPEGAAHDDSASIESEQTSSLPLWLVHVGDSRCYRWRQRNLERLTMDHSLVEEQVRAGQITAEQALESPMRNVITRAVGTQATVDPEIHSLFPRTGDLYLLASDGLTRELSDDEIAAILCRMPSEISQGTLHSTTRALVEAANERGGNDNITVLLVGFVPA